jgi:hypothetical protein
LQKSAGRVAGEGDDMAMLMVDENAVIFYQLKEEGFVSH